MNLLKELYNISSPSRQEDKMRKFICSKLKALGVRYEKDKVGNIYAVKGSAESYPCIVAHIDEVHKRRNKNFTVTTLNDDVVFGFDFTTNKFCGIGADDKNGIWVCLKCLEEFEAVKCAFFVGEEIGCIGSSQAKMSFFDDCRFVLQCDRKGNGDVIRWADSIELCSDEFGEAIKATEYGYSITHGLMTDVQALKQNDLKVSCINISCGYYNPHTDNELTRISDLNKCLVFVQHIIADCTGTYPHKHIPQIKQRGYGEFEWGGFLPSIYSGRTYYQQLCALRARMESILRHEPHLSLDEVLSRIGNRYDLISLSDYQDAYLKAFCGVSQDAPNNHQNY